MPKRGIGFTVQEVDVLLTAIERFLPIGPYEWDRVLAEHESHFPEAGRTKESLKRKFTMLYKTRHPTGDPDIPEDVLRAKRVYEEIKKKAEVSEGEGSDDKVFATHSLRAVAVMVEECNAVVYDVQTQKAACSRFSDTSNDISVQNSTAVCASGKVCTSSTGT